MRKYHSVMRHQFVKIFTLNGPKMLQITWVEEDPQKGPMALGITCTGYKANNAGEWAKMVKEGRTVRFVSCVIRHILYSANENSAAAMLSCTETRRIVSLQPTRWEAPDHCG